MASLLRRSVQMATRRTRTVRRFGSSANVQYEGAEAKLREVLPHDHQIVLACLGAYGAAIFLYKMGGSSEPAAAPVAAAPAASVSGGAIPSMADANFDDWIKVPGNADKYAKSFE
jgi:hypothetical protein